MLCTTVVIWLFVQILGVVIGWTDGLVLLSEGTLCTYMATACRRRYCGEHLPRLAAF